MWKIGRCLEEIIYFSQKQWGCHRSIEYDQIDHWAKFEVGLAPLGGGGHGEVQKYFVNVRRLRSSLYSIFLIIDVMNSSSDNFWKGRLSSLQILQKCIIFSLSAWGSFRVFFIGIRWYSITSNMVPITTSVTFNSFKSLRDILSTCTAGVPRVWVISCRFCEVAHRVTDFRKQARPS